MALIYNMCHILIAQLKTKFFNELFFLWKDQVELWVSGSAPADWCLKWRLDGNFYKPSRPLLQHLGDSHESPGLISVTLFTGTVAEEPLDPVAG